MNSEMYLRIIAIQNSKGKIALILFIWNVQQLALVLVNSKSMKTSIIGISWLSIFEMKVKYKNIVNRSDEWIFLYRAFYGIAS